MEYIVLTNSKKKAIKSYFNDLRESGYTLAEISGERGIPTKTLYNIRKGIVKKIKLETYIKLEELIYDYLYELNPLEIIFPKEEHEDIVPKNIIDIGLKISYIQSKTELLTKRYEIKELQKQLEKNKQSNEYVIDALLKQNEYFEDLIIKLKDDTK